MNYFFAHTCAPFRTSINDNWIYFDISQKGCGAARNTFSKMFFLKQRFIKDSMGLAWHWNTVSPFLWALGHFTIYHVFSLLMNGFWQIRTQNNHESVI